VRYKRPRQAHSAVRDCCLGHSARYAALVLTPPLKRPRNATKQWKKEREKWKEEVRAGAGAASLN
jgi:hypothetical protein